jgi:hypothetical protein
VDVLCEAAFRWGGAAAERGDEPVKALGVKMLNDAPSVINVRFAGYRCCSADRGRNRQVN